MLFLPWRNEEDNLSGGFQTYEEHYMAKQSLIAPMRQKYEMFNDSLELAIEEVENADLDDMYDDMDAAILNRVTKMTMDSLTQTGQKNKGSMILDTNFCS